MRTEFCDTRRGLMRTKHLVKNVQSHQKWASYCSRHACNDCNGSEQTWRAKLQNKRLRRNFRVQQLIFPVECCDPEKYGCVYVGIGGTDWPFFRLSK